MLEFSAVESGLRSLKPDLHHLSAEITATPETLFITEEHAHARTEETPPDSPAQKKQSKYCCIYISALVRRF